MANSTINLKPAPHGKGGRTVNLPVDGGAHIYAGTLVAQLNATAMACPGSTASSGPAVGVALHEQDNTDGNDGDLLVEVMYDQIFVMANATAGDACSTATPFGAPVFMKDDHTIADNSNAGAWEAAGYFAGMEPDGRVRFYIGIRQPSAGSGGEEFDNGIATDTISELTAATGVTVDGVLLKDGGAVFADAATIEVDTINEATAAAGVTVDGVLLKDAKVTATGGGDFGTSPGVITDIVAEKTGANGVTVDGLSIKDGGLPVFAPSISKIQIAGGTFANGTATINAGITVTADTDAFVIMSAVVTGSANVGCLAHLKASNVVGGAGVGAVTLNILGDDGAVDGDAAGAFRVLLVN